MKLYLRNLFLGIPLNAILSSESRTKINEELSNLGVVSYFINILLFSLVNLFFLAGYNIKYICALGLVFNIVVPLFYIYIIKKNKYIVIENKNSIKRTFPWVRGVVIALLYYILSMIFTDDSLNSIWDLKTAIISIGFGVFMALVLYFTQHIMINEKHN